ncbi:MAG: diguanylate cyclase [Erysipelotrichaceae bacterium]|nr:diguanylate cyclase [Erysipelotrichaceae bacterium]
MNKNKSIIKLTTISFVVILLLSIGSVTFVVFNQWRVSVEAMTANIVDDINEHIYLQLNNYMSKSWDLNENHYRFIADDIIDITQQNQREKFFVGVLNAQSTDIYSFGFGSELGEYYGARRNTDNVIEIMMNNSDTNNNSWYYSVNDNLTADQLIMITDKFDVRTRPWYQIAKDNQQPAFSSIYKHFVMDDLTVSAAWPVYDKNGQFIGVLGSHMLLSDIGAFLETQINKYDGYAIIFEKDSGDLIANSMMIDNYQQEDKTITRRSIKSFETQQFDQIYQQYLINDKKDFTYNGINSSLMVNILEFQFENLDWVILSAIPASLFMGNVYTSIRLTIGIVFVILIIIFILNQVVTSKLLKPLRELKNVSSNIAAGDLNSRFMSKRNDEIGEIGNSFNLVADKMQSLISNLETSVAQRTAELNRTNVELTTSKDNLQLILDSTAEAIYGQDIAGVCTFCNMSLLNMLGYENQSDVLGKDMHELIHHSNPDKSKLNVSECKIHQSVNSGIGVVVDDEVFWRADGQSIMVEYRAFPQAINGKVVGMVVTFSDITQRKNKEAQVEYLSSHDVLTGLYNRRKFEALLDDIDQKDNLPISIIFTDINGLKLTNDIFGHQAGDDLIIASAEILRKICRDLDIIGRVGGDEFIILLPNTDKDEVEKIIKRIKDEFACLKLSAIKGSISIGFATKTSSLTPITEVLADAENQMYKNKTINRQSVNKEMINTLIETLHNRVNSESAHSVNVKAYSLKMGEALNLSKTELSKLTEAAYLHDIGKITLDKELLTKPVFTSEDYELMQQHPVVGYRILNLFDDMLDIAEYVYYHHERWDGKGYPIGLVSNQIPIISRIIAIAETYDRIVKSNQNPEKELKDYAFKVIKEGASYQFDPELASLFCQLFE